MRFFIEITLSKYEHRQSYILGRMNRIREKRNRMRSFYPDQKIRLACPSILIMLPGWGNENYQKTGFKLIPFSHRSTTVGALS